METEFQARQGDGTNMDFQANDEQRVIIALSDSK